MAGLRLKMKTNDFGFVLIGLLVGMVFTYAVMAARSSPIYEVQMQGAVMIKLNKVTGQVWVVADGDWKPVGRHD